MKKIVSVISAVLLLGNFAVFAQESASSSESWEKINEQGAKVIRETGKFLQAITKQAGETIANGVTELSTIQCEGTWSYTSSENVKTIITVSKDGAFSLVQKKGLESIYFNGTCTGTAHILNIKLSEGGHKTFFKKSDNSMNVSLIVTYQVNQDKMSCNFAISGLTSSLDSTDYSKGLNFLRVN